MTKARSSIVKDGIEGVYHCISRCVRRAFLCGRDSITNRNFEHRKQWIHQRLVVLADIFLIDVCGYAIMDNHLHVILRNRPDLAADCSDQDIASRWWRLFPKRRNRWHQPEQPTEEELAVLLAGQDRAAELRQRLASISWFMRCLKEPIARRANAEDQCTGRFWEGRFKSVALLDQAAILTCSAYVDLNPIRAGIAPTPEASAYTSVQERIRARQAGRKRNTLENALVSKRLTDGDSMGIKLRPHDHWLCPLRNEGNRRGYLNIELDDYLELLDWTGRQIVEDKKGAVPPHLAPILTRLAVDHEQWLRSSRKFGSMFYRVAGTMSRMTQAALGAGQQWLKGMHAGHIAFLNG